MLNNSKTSKHVPHRDLMALFGQGNDNENSPSLPPSSPSIAPSPSQSPKKPRIHYGVPSKDFHKLGLHDKASRKRVADVLAKPREELFRQFHQILFQCTPIRNYINAGKQLRKMRFLPYDGPYSMFYAYESLVSGIWKVPSGLNNGSFKKKLMVCFPFVAIHKVRIRMPKETFKLLAPLSKDRRMRVTCVQRLALRDTSKPKERGHIKQRLEKVIVEWQFCDAPPFKVDGASPTEQADDILKFIDEWKLQADRHIFEATVAAQDTREAVVSDSPVRTRKRKLRSPRQLKTVKTSLGDVETVSHDRQLNSIDAAFRLHNNMIPKLIHVTPGEQMDDIIKRVAFTFCDPSVAVITNDKHFEITTSAMINNVDVFYGWSVSDLENSWSESRR